MQEISYVSSSSENSDDNFSADEEAKEFVKKHKIKEPFQDPIKDLTKSMNDYMEFDRKIKGKQNQSNVPIHVPLKIEIPQIDYEPRSILIDDYDYSAPKLVKSETKTLVKEKFEDKIDEIIVNETFKVENKENKIDHDIDIDFILPKKFPKPNPTDLNKKIQTLSPTGYKSNGIYFNIKLNITN